MAENLFSLHKAGFAHDDIKMDNCLYDIIKKKWVLIDLDLASPLGTNWDYRGTPGYYATSGPSSRNRDLLHTLLLLSNMTHQDYFL